MITETLLTILKNLLLFILRLLPSASSLPSGIDSAFSYFSGIFSQVNYLIPLDTLFSLLSFILVFEASIFLFHMLNFIYNKFRGSGG